MQLISQLEATRDETLRYFTLGDAELARTYGPGKWSVRYILHHLADSETVLYERIRRVVSEPRQVIWWYDQDAWAAGLNYAAVPLPIAARIYESVRAAMIYHAGVHYERNGHLEFVHSKTGVRTLKDEFDKTAAHNEHHLSQIRAALVSGGRGSSAPVAGRAGTGPLRDWESSPRRPSRRVIRRSARERDRDRTGPSGRAWRATRPDGSTRGAHRS